MSTITSGGTTINPVAVYDFSSSRPSGNKTHRIPGRAEPDVTRRVAGLRTGTLRLAFRNAADSLAAENLHASGGICTLVADPLTMSYVVADGGSIVRSRTKAGAWTLEVDFQEVTT
ncbi:hypothetical protein [Microbacterium sp. GXF7504]